MSFAAAIPLIAALYAAATGVCARAFHAVPDALEFSRVTPPLATLFALPAAAITSLCTW